MVEDRGTFEALLQEDRTFPPTDEFCKQANISDPDIYEKALANPEGFWSDFANELHWFQKWNQECCQTPTSWTFHDTSDHLLYFTMFLFYPLRLTN